MPSSEAKGNPDAGLSNLQDTESSASASGSRFSGILLIAALLGGCLIALGYFLEGKNGFEKTATQLVMPVGILWLLLSGVVIQQLRHASVVRTLPAWSLWLILTVASTSPLPDACLASLESRETVFRPGEDADLDVLVVLGGGTRQGPTRAQAGDAGDRVVFAAELYVSGRAKRLITTGDSMPGLAGQRSSPQEHTFEIWTSLGIPTESIGKIGGINTFQEMQNLKAIMPELAGQRVGLLTSAAHLPRAMRLARAQGLSELIPVAADYQSSVESYGFTNFIPSAASLGQLASCQKEFMAKLLGR